MVAKTAERDIALRLRKKGSSYNEILGQVPVAKSTLSLWLRGVGLAKKQRQRLSEKKRIAQLKGARVRKEERIARSIEIKKKAAQEIGEIHERELRMIGSALYWAEGSKQKETNVAERVGFSNSDPFMVKIFLLFLKRICQINFEDIKLDLIIHESGNLVKAKKFWSKVLKIDSNNLRVYFKNHKLTRRKNVGDNYFGLIRVTVKKSTDLNRKISGWVEGIYRNCGVV